jgi:hypothetical protein
VTIRPSRRGHATVVSRLVRSDDGETSEATVHEEGEETHEASFGGDSARGEFVSEEGEEGECRFGGGQGFGAVGGGGGRREGFFEEHGERDWLLVFMPFPVVVVVVVVGRCPRGLWYWTLTVVGRHDTVILCERQ